MANFGLQKWLRPAVAALPSRGKLGLALLLILIFLIVATPLFNRWMYPLDYEDKILYSADTTGADPFLVMAIIRAESKFSPNAESHAGAKGLMQLTPNTVEWVVERGSFPQRSKNPSMILRSISIWAVGISLD